MLTWDCALGVCATVFIKVSIALSTFSVDKLTVGGVNKVHRALGVGFVHGKGFCLH